MATDSIKCKYFPQLPTRWYCSNCKANMANERAKAVGPNILTTKKSALFASSRYSRLA